MFIHYATSNVFVFAIALEDIAAGEAEDGTLMISVGNFMNYLWLFQRLCVYTYHGLYIVYIYIHMRQEQPPDWGFAHGT